MALPAALVSALGFGLPVVAVATGAVLFATAGPVASPGGVGVATVWLDSPHEASVLAAGEVPVVVHATADRAPTSLVLVVDGVVVGERPAGAPVLGRLVEAIIPWQATVGPHTLQARAGDLASPIVPVVVVSPSGSAPTAAPTAVPTLSGPTSTATAMPTAATPPTTATKPSTTRPRHESDDEPTHDEAINVDRSSGPGGDVRDPVSDGSRRGPRVLDRRHGHFREGHWVGNVGEVHLGRRDDLRLGFADQRGFRDVDRLDQLRRPVTAGRYGSSDHHGDSHEPHGQRVSPGCWDDCQLQALSRRTHNGGAGVHGVGRRAGRTGGGDRLPDRSGQPSSVAPVPRLGGGCRCRVDWRRSVPGLARAGAAPAWSGVLSDPLPRQADSHVVDVVHQSGPGCSGLHDRGGDNGRGRRGPGAAYLRERSVVRAPRLLLGYMAGQAEHAHRLTMQRLPEVLARAT